MTKKKLLDGLGTLDCGLGSFVGFSLKIAAAEREARVVEWEKRR